MPLPAVVDKVKESDYWAHAPRRPLKRRRADLIRMLGQMSRVLLRKQIEDPHIQVFRVRLDAFAQALEAFSSEWHAPFVHAPDPEGRTINSGLIPLDGEEWLLAERLAEVETCRAGKNLKYLSETYLWSLLESYKRILQPDIEAQDRFVIAFWGRVSSGKSTLINTIFGTQLPVDDAECTMVPARITFSSKAADRILVRLVRTQRSTLEGLHAYAEANAEAILQDPTRAAHYKDELERTLGDEDFLDAQLEAEERSRERFAQCLVNPEMQLNVEDIYVRGAADLHRQYAKRIEWLRLHRPIDPHASLKGEYRSRLRAEAPLDLEDWLAERVGAMAARHVRRGLTYQAVEIVMDGGVIPSVIREEIRSCEGLSPEKLMILDLPGYNTTRNVHARYYCDAASAAADAAVCVLRSREPGAFEQLSDFIRLFTGVRGALEDPPVIIVPSFTLFEVEVKTKKLPSWTGYELVINDESLELKNFAARLQSTPRVGFVVPTEFLADLPGGENFAGDQVDEFLHSGRFARDFEEWHEPWDERGGPFRKALMAFFDDDPGLAQLDAAAFLKQTHQMFTRAPRLLMRHLLAIHEGARRLRARLEREVRRDVSVMLQRYISLRLERYLGINSFAEFAATTTEDYKATLHRLLQAEVAGKTSSWLRELREKLGARLVELCTEHGRLKNIEFRRKLKEILAGELPGYLEAIEGLADRRQFHAPLALTLLVMLQQPIDERLPRDARRQAFEAILDFTLNEVPEVLDAISDLFHVDEAEIENHPHFLVFKHDRELLKLGEGGA